MQNTLVLNLPVSLAHCFSLKTILNIKFLWVLGFISIISLLSFYIFQVNKVVSEGYLVQEYQNKFTKLREENKILEINSVQINSLANIQNKIQELGFEKAGKVNYIQVLESQIAREQIR